MQKSLFVGGKVSANLGSSVDPQIDSLVANLVGEASLGFPIHCKL